MLLFYNMTLFTYVHLLVFGTSNRFKILKFLHGRVLLLLDKFTILSRYYISEYHGYEEKIDEKNLNYLINHYVI